MGLVWKLSRSDQLPDEKKISADKVVANGTGWGRLVGKLVTESATAAVAGWERLFWNLSRSEQLPDEKKISADEVVASEEAQLLIEGEDRALPIHIGVGTNVHVGCCSLGCWI